MILKSTIVGRSVKVSKFQNSFIRSNLIRDINHTKQLIWVHIMAAIPLNKDTPPIDDNLICPSESCG